MWTSSTFISSERAVLYYRGVRIRSSKRMSSLTKDLRGTEAIGEAEQILV